MAKRERIAIAVFMLLGLAAFGLGLFGSGTFGEVRRLRVDLVTLEAEIEELKRERDKLTQEVDQLKNDREAVAQRARDKLGMIKPGERVIYFKDSKGGAGETPSADE